MANIIDYVRTQLDTFEQRDVCRVDSLVLSWLSYYRLPEGAEAARTAEGMSLRDLYRAEWFDAMCGKLYDAHSSVELLSAAAASPRFRDVRVCEYVSCLNERRSQQFSAMTFRLGSRATYVAFRGTDNTLVGWKEDFNMAFQSVVPSQTSAMSYLNRVGKQAEGRLWCGGHSKGGNLAVYAGMLCDPDVQGRLVTCFSHDGPGFTHKVMDDPRWEHAQVLIDKTIPQSSVIGMLFENQEKDVRVVHSTSVGFSQHDPFSWEVDWRDFVVEQKVGRGASVLDSSLDAWLSKSTDEEREHFVDAVFSVIEASGQSTFADVKANWRTTFPRMIAAAAQLPAEDRKYVTAALGAIAKP